MKRFLAALSLSFIASGYVFAQESAQRFTSQPIAFEYPFGFTVTDGSTDEAHIFFISKPKTSILIVIASPRERIVTTEQFRKTQHKIFDGYIKAIKRSLTSGEDGPRQEFLCTRFHNRSITGAKFIGQYKGAPATGEVYPLQYNGRFLTLVHMRTDNENTDSTRAWETIAASLKFGDSQPEDDNVTSYAEEIEGGVLNGEAIKLVRPIITKEERQFLSRGSIEVSVVIDETGTVTSASAKSGSRLARSIVEKAARQSKFKPTIVCEHAIKVRGVIVYNFF